MNRKPLAYLADILESCEAIDSALFGLEEEDYLVNRLVRSSVEREFTIIGDAVLALSRKAQDVFASITGAPRAVAARRSNSCGLSPPMSAIDSPAARLAAGERSLQSWLALVGRQAVPLPMEPLLSVNQPADLALFNRREFLQEAGICHEALGKDRLMLLLQSPVGDLPGHMQEVRGQDIRTIQEILGHSDIKTTMIYTHMLNRGQLGVCNPADLL